MNEWENTPLPTDKEQLRKWFENKIRAYAHQASIAEGLQKEQAVERLLDAVLEMAQHQLVPSIDVFEGIGSKGPDEDLKALVFAAHSHIVEIHKSECGGPLHSEELRAIYVVGERLLDKAWKVVKMVRIGRQE